MKETVSFSLSIIAISKLNNYSAATNKSKSDILQELIIKELTKENAIESLQNKLNELRGLESFENKYTKED